MTPLDLERLLSGFTSCRQVWLPYALIGAIFGPADIAVNAAFTDWTNRRGITFEVEPRFARVSLILPCGSIARS